LISWPTYAHSLEELVTVLSVVCHACFSVLSWAIVADNYARSLARLERYAEAKSVLRKMMPTVRALGEDHFQTIKMRWRYAEVVLRDTSATLDDLREAVETLEDIARTARRVLGGAHPTTGGIEQHLRTARAALYLALCESGAS